MRNSIIRKNKSAGIIIGDISKDLDEITISATISKNKISENTIGIWGYGKHQLTIEQNKIVFNQSVGIKLQQEIQATVLRNQICKTDGNAIWLDKKALGILKENDIYEQSSPQIAITEGASAEIIDNRIYSGDDSGIFINSPAKTLMEIEQTIIAVRTSP